MGKKYLFIVSKFNEAITKSLLEGGVKELEELGVSESDVEVTWVPGAFEIPGLARKAVSTGKYDALVCLGCVIRGQTPHFEYVAGQSAAGLMRVSMESDIPVINGILTTDNSEQAMERCGLKSGNKGRYAARAAFDMIKNYEKIMDNSRL